MVYVGGAAVFSLSLRCRWCVVWGIFPTFFDQLSTTYKRRMVLHIQDHRQAFRLPSPSRTGGKGVIGSRRGWGYPRRLLGICRRPNCCVELLECRDVLGTLEMSSQSSWKNLKKLNLARESTCTSRRALTIVGPPMYHVLMPGVCLYLTYRNNIEDTSGQSCARAT